MTIPTAYRSLGRTLYRILKRSTTEIRPCLLRHPHFGTQHETWTQFVRGHARTPVRGIQATEEECRTHSCPQEGATRTLAMTPGWSHNLPRCSAILSLGGQVSKLRAPFCPGTGAFLHQGS